MREDLLKRFLARTDLGKLVPGGVDFAAQRRGGGSAGREIGLSAAPFAGDGFELKLALGSDLLDLPGGGF